VWVLAKTIYEDNKSLEDRLADVEAELVRLKDVYPQMLIEISEADNSRYGRVYAKVLSDSQQRTVHGVQLAITKVVKESDGCDVKPATPYKEVLLRPFRASENVSINSGSHELFDLADYDAASGKIQFGHHNDADSFKLPADTYSLELCCTGRDLRPGSLKCVISVNDGQLTYKVI
jgi:hypothetical protein